MNVGLINFTLSIFVVFSDYYLMSDLLSFLTFDLLISINNKSY